MNIFSQIERFIDEEIYTKILTKSNIDLTTTETEIFEFNTSDRIAVIHEIAADNTVDAEIQIYVDDSAVGEKYGTPIKTKALPANGQPIKLNIVVEKNKKLTFKARMTSGTGTLGFVRITILMVRR